MPRRNWKVAASVNVEDSSCRSPCASDGLGIKKQMLNSSDSMDVNEEVVSESLRIRTYC